RYVGGHRKALQNCLNRLRPLVGKYRPPYGRTSGTNGKNSLANETTLLAEFLQTRRPEKQYL
ncbi:MAG: hypothetical protein ROW52_08995, partial [Anaerolineaceae bacterium]